MSNNLFDVLIGDNKNILNEYILTNENMIDYFCRQSDYFNRQSFITLENKKIPVHLSYEKHSFDWGISYEDCLCVKIEDIGLEYLLSYSGYSNSVKNFSINRIIVLPFLPYIEKIFYVDHFFDNDSLNNNLNKIFIYKRFFDIILSNSISDYFYAIQLSYPAKEIMSYKINCLSDEEDKIYSVIKVKDLMDSIQVIKKKQKNSQGNL